MILYKLLLAFTTASLTGSNVNLCYCSGTVRGATGWTVSGSWSTVGLILSFFPVTVSLLGVTLRKISHDSHVVAGSVLCKMYFSPRISDPLLDRELKQLSCVNCQILWSTVIDFWVMKLCLPCMKKTLVWPYVSPRNAEAQFARIMFWLPQNHSSECEISSLYLGWHSRQAFFALWQTLNFSLVPISMYSS